ncbi:ATP-binding protein [Streptomyces sp. NPDC096094]|uniref:ATP-binding protein n=1 Tax=Streptomyces sp. NPDC096094 TaxID=3366073 RepID=UPI003830B687
MTIGRILSTERDDLTERDGRTVLTETTSPGDEPRRSAGRFPEPDGGEPERRPFTARFPSSPRGAQLARRHAVRWLEDRGHPPTSDVSCTAALVVGELAANAVQHGRVPGREFGLRLTLDLAKGLLRVEVDDAASAKRLPRVAPSSYPEGESGRGLLLVDVLAARWGSLPRRPVGKTVWAELRAGEGECHDGTRRARRR